MRLIDADNIKGCAKYIKTNENFEPYIMVDDLVKVLDEQPTAYDIDKVVEELEIEKNKFSTLVEQCNKTGDFVMAEIYSQMSSEYTTAIEFVKHGGVGKVVG